MSFSILMGASTYICGLFTGCIYTYLYINYNNIYDKVQEDAIILSYKTIQLYTNIKENAFVKRITQWSQCFYMSIIHFVYNTVIEPPGAFWIYCCNLEKKNVQLYDSFLNGSEANDFKKHKYILNEKYNEMTKNDMNTICQTDLSSFINARLIIMKVMDHYIVRRGENINPVKIKKSKYGFLSVEYLHPKQSEPIILNINKNMFMEGNELFTPEFVLRTLIYQNIDYYFDLNYKIRIMDNNINIFEITSDQYIEFTDNSYIIHLLLFNMPISGVELHRPK